MNLFFLWRCDFMSIRHRRTKEKVNEMSFDKNTINNSEIDAAIKVLEDIDIPYKLTEIGIIHGFGINDIDGAGYPIRRLEYLNTVMLERIDRTTDCDADDTIHSYKFVRGEEPKDWEIERIYDEYFMEEENE